MTNSELAEAITQKLIEMGYVPNCLNYPSSVESAVKEILTTSL